MNITLDRDHLHAALGRITRIVEKRTTIPILANIVMAAEGERLTITGTDLDIEIVTACAGEVKQAGTCTAPAHTLSDIVGKLPKGATIVLETAEDDKGGAPLLLKSGRAKFSLSTLPAADAPELKVPEPKHAFAIAPRLLDELLSRTQFAISTEETRYYLNGTYLHAAAGPDGPMLTAVATDGHRLARMALVCPPFTQGEALAMPGVIIPAKTVVEILRQIKDQDGEVAISHDGARIRVAFPDGRTVLTSKLIDGTFPDYLRVIPRNHPHRAEVDRQALDEACDRVGTISSERGRGVRFGFADNELALTVVNPDGGNAEDQLTADWNGAATDIGFNGAYVRSILAHLRGKTIAVLLNTPGEPSVWTEAKDDGFLAVLMPMRV